MIPFQKLKAIWITTIASFVKKIIIFQNIIGDLSIVAIKKCAAFSIMPLSSTTFPEPLDSWDTAQTGVEK